MDAPIYFTSSRDDSIGGDVNGDGGATTPNGNDWNHIAINSGGSATFEHCIVRYGGGYYAFPEIGPHANLKCYTGGTMSVSNCTVTRSWGYGIYSNAAGQVVANSIIAYNGSYGVYLTGGSPQVLYCDLWSNGTNYTGNPDLTGTIFADPLFVNAAAGDYQLQTNSLCIDTGDPTTSGPDGTRSDMGALPYTNPIPRISIAGSKNKAGTETVRFSSVVVTTAFPDYFYVEADDRSCGIRVNKPGHSVTAGMRVDATGTPETSSDGERCIAAATITLHGTGSVGPLAMNNRAIGGGAFGLQDGIWGLQSVKDGNWNWQWVWMPVAGLNNIGLLIRTWGSVTYVDQHTFTLDDGSGQHVKCVTSSDVTVDPTWTYVAVTGISSCEKVGAELHRLVRIRKQTDIIRYQ